MLKLMMCYQKIAYKFILFKHIIYVKYYKNIQF